MNRLEYFVDKIFAPIVILFGLYGNTMGILVLARSNVRKIGPIYIYRFLFVVDSLCLLQCAISYMKYAHSIDLTIWYGLISCKLTNYAGYTLDATSPYLLVYISVEKYIAIAYPGKRSILRGVRNQLIFLAALFTINGLLYIEIFFFFDVIKQQDSSRQSEYECRFLSYTEQLTVSYIDLINRLIVPLTLMTYFSTVLISAIFKSRQRVSSTLSTENIQLKRDIRFAITSFSMNMLFFMLNLPVSLVYFLPDMIGSNIVYFSAFYFYFISYAVNFYIIVITNKLFRREFFAFYCHKHNAINRNTTQEHKRASNYFEISMENLV